MDDEIRAGFERFGFKDDELKWCIDFNSFCQEIDKINQSYPIFLSHQTVFHFIYEVYYPLKIRKLVYQELGFWKIYDGVPTMEATILFKNFFQNVKNRTKKGHNIVKTPLDEDMVEILDSFKKSIGEANVDLQKLLLSGIEGDIESYALKPIFNELLFKYHKEFSDGHVYEAIFDLLNMILKDHYWRSEKDFFHNQYTDEKNEPTYRANYTQYKKITVRNFLRTSKSKSDKI